MSFKIKSSVHAHQVLERASGFWGCLSINDAPKFDHRCLIIFVQTPSGWVCQGPTNKDKEQEQIDTWIEDILSYILGFNLLFSSCMMKGLLLST